MSTWQQARDRAQSALDRANAATDGPWAHWPEAGRVEVYRDGTDQVIAKMRPRLGRGGEIYEPTGRRPGGDEPNGEFIAEARTDVPALAAAALAALDLHQSDHYHGEEEWPFCVEDGFGYPCDTARAFGVTE